MEAWNQMLQPPTFCCHGETGKGSLSPSAFWVSAGHPLSWWLLHKFPHSMLAKDTPASAVGNHILQRTGFPARPGELQKQLYCTTEK